MAEGNTDGSVEIQREVSNGFNWHLFTFKFSLQNDQLRQPWIFREEFRTCCLFGPTSWLLQMLFQPMTDDGRICIPLTLWRIDPAYNSVLVRVEPYINDEVNKCSPKVPAIEREIIRGGEIIEETLLEDFPMNLELHVSVFVWVVSCHKFT
ncbi:unnamed protein product [Larinioides sclopetarius]|uniref:Uncharacterized protein n=1 Tax=Larinioides sclopetarius TaxID=280406 RepID=A0AAV2BC58_9ARAC